MRTTISFLIIFITAYLFTSCSKGGNPDPSPAPVPPVSNDFTKFTIRKGQQYCDQTTIVPVAYDELKFIVKFDNSASYQTIDPANQEDINKLFGFSDNNKLHQEYSARFGWNWSRDSLRLFAYVYNNSVRTFKEISAILTGTEYNASIKVENSNYIFTLNDKTVEMPRESTTAKGEGYKLFPYFGGDEVAPHDITIWIKEDH
jgi:hypothetical protein